MRISSFFAKIFTLSEKSRKFLQNRRYWVVVSQLLDFCPSFWSSNFVQMYWMTLLIFFRWEAPILTLMTSHSTLLVTLLAHHNYHKHVDVTSYQQKLECCRFRVTRSPQTVITAFTSRRRSWSPGCTPEQKESDSLFRGKSTENRKQIKMQLDNDFNNVSFKPWIDTVTNKKKCRVFF